VCSPKNFLFPTIFKNSRVFSWLAAPVKLNFRSQCHQTFFSSTVFFVAFKDTFPFVEVDHQEFAEGIETMGTQGRRLSELEVRRIVSLLSETDLQIPEIAERMNCSRSVVTSINRRWHVRSYKGQRSKWQGSTEERQPKLSNEPARPRSA
jgi:hypothetical protein